MHKTSPQYRWCLHFCDTVVNTVVRTQKKEEGACNFYSIKSMDKYETE